MAGEDVEESEIEQSDEGAAVNSDSEKNQGEAADLLQEIAEKALVEQLEKIVACIVVNIELKHLPSAKLLFDLAARLKAAKEIPESEYMSLADLLWKAHREQESVANALESRDLVAA